jgi:hypothetical protein
MSGRFIYCNKKYILCSLQSHFKGTVANDRVQLFVNHANEEFKKSCYTLFSSTVYKKNNQIQIRDRTFPVYLRLNQQET